jgi:biotin carboxyl carrier protein
MVKPTTRFVAAYLAGVGALARAGRDLELELAWELLAARQARQGPQAAQALEPKRSLILRPLRRLYGYPHLMAGWLAPREQRRFVLEGGRVAWRQNPLEVLEQLYRYLRLEDRPGVSPEERIWPHDQELLDTGLAFYQELRQRLEGGAANWPELSALLERDEAPPGIPTELWPEVRAAHRGHQAGLALLELPPLTGEESGFYGIGVDEALEVRMPEAFTREPEAAALRLALDEAPAARSDQVVAFTGGTFYSRPSPDEPHYVTEGQHVEPGEVLGLLEVMKMFNPVRAGFAGTLVKAELHAEGGQLVTKGQPLFRIEPDVPIVRESEGERLARLRARTGALLARV